MNNGSTPAKRMATAAASAVGRKLTPQQREMIQNADPDQIAAAQDQVTSVLEQQAKEAKKMSSWAIFLTIAMIALQLAVIITIFMTKKDTSDIVAIMGQLGLAKADKKQQK